MSTETNRPSPEVPEPDWNDQLRDAAVIDEEQEEEFDVGPTAVREAGEGDIAEQRITVRFDDDDGYTTAEDPTE